MTNFNVGDKVIWLKRVQGGDFVYPVHAVVIAMTAKRMKIEADDDGRIVVRYVPLESLQEQFESKERTMSATTNEKIRAEIETLVKHGKDIATYKVGIETAKELVQKGDGRKKIDALAKMPDLTSPKYQQWYTQSLPVVQQLLPDRYHEFQDHYRLEKRKGVFASTYTISDYLAGITVRPFSPDAFDTFGIFLSRFTAQIDILESALSRLDSILANIQAVLHAQLFDDELSVAKELLKKSHLRAAGAVAGVVVERHLGQVAVAHALPLHKKDPTISDLNDALKNAGVIDVPDWRFVQRLGDIRNLCVHSKDRDPTHDEIDDLIHGAEKIIKTIF